ncbi:MAG: DUF2164 domain-containing protein [Gemmatimonadota bacterium]
MAVTLPDDIRKQALASINRFCRQELELDSSGIQDAQLLDFVLKEIAPSVYNAGVTDARAFMLDRFADLEGTCYEPEFVYWPKSGSVRRK